jgi:hypothetical protein
MTNRYSQEDRAGYLISQLVDGEPSREALDELNELVLSGTSSTILVVDHLILDSLLSEDLSRDSLATLIDLVADSEVTDASLNSDTDAVRPKARLAPNGRRRRTSWYLHTASWIVAVAALILVVAIIARRTQKEAFADATRIVQAAVYAHAEPVERVYAVKVERHDSPSPDFVLPRDVRVSTFGNRFWVEIMSVRGHLCFGRGEDGEIWVALGQWRGMRIEPDEVGPMLQDIADLYSLNLESLLQGVLEGHELETLVTEGTTRAIKAIPKSPHHGWVRKATIEVDQETKAVRRLVVQRLAPRGGSATVTFTLVDARLPDESQYRLEGHVSKPDRVLTRESRPDRRRVLLENWIGPLAKGWIIDNRQASDQK